MDKVDMTLIMASSAVIVAQSRLEPDVRNPSGATGLWQIMPAWFGKVRWWWVSAFCALAAWLCVLPRQ